MNGIESLRSGDTVTFGRDCEVIQIPMGTKVTVPKNTQAFVGQALGGNLTVEVTGRGLVQVPSTQLDAICKDGQPIAAPVAPSAATAEGPVDEKAVWEALKTCYDPEIPVNIVDLGLVYDVKITGGRVDVKMTLTAMGCGMGPVIAMQAKDKLLACSGVKEADVQIVWDPPWNQSMMTDDAKKRLGLW
jgi:probable FeS assembly SUF system protein SufT